LTSIIRCEPHARPPVYSQFACIGNGLLGARQGGRHGIPERRPRHHTQNIAKQLQDTIARLREDVKKVDEPQLKAMFETGGRGARRPRQGVQGLRAEERSRVAEITPAKQEHEMERERDSTRRGFARLAGAAGLVTIADCGLP